MLKRDGDWGLGIGDRKRKTCEGVWCYGVEGEKRRMAFWAFFPSKSQQALLPTKIHLHRRFTGRDRRDLHTRFHHHCVIFRLCKRNPRDGYVFSIIMYSSVNLSTQIITLTHTHSHSLSLSSKATEITAPSDNCNLHCPVHPVDPNHDNWK